METTGLTTTEAKALLNKIGPNKISIEHRFSFFGLLCSETFNLLNILLMIASAVSLMIGDLLDSILIFAIVILNTIISFWQEYKAERTLQELRNLTHTYVKVLRDGKMSQIDSVELIPGDVIHLESGDKIPADGVIFQSCGLEANEASLSGESLPVFKRSEAGHNQVVAGTLISAGHGIVLVSATGMSTRFGRIALSLKGIKETETPLQKQIKHLALNIGLIALALSVLIYFVGVSLGQRAVDMFLTSVSAAVAAIPEGVPAIILITLAVGERRMAQRKAVIRKIIAVEALGAGNVIATDKTGTLAKGEMRAEKLYVLGKHYTPQSIKTALNQPKMKKFLDALVIPNTASLLYRFDHGTKAVLGDSTEGALLQLAEFLGINTELHKASAEILEEFSFDQKRKSMSMVVRKDGKVEALVKSSPEFMVSASTRIPQDDRIKILTEEDKQQLADVYSSLTKSGYRVLGFGYKPMDEQTGYRRDEIESDLIFLGFIAVSDPIRDEVKESIRLAKQAGIMTVMITGDNELTAHAVAVKLELAEEGEEMITGKDLEKISDEQLKNIIQKVRVFARTNPEDKLRIVKAFQQLGLSVAVTGDGVNDALALKQAEVGVAMGKKGTDVAKEAADIVITDDNYATIVKAIEEGRTIYDNVLKSIRYLVSTNLSELLTILIALILGLPSPLLPAQILWINLVSDGFPAIALALDPKDPMAMKKLPRSKEHRLLNLNSLALLIGIGLAVSLIALIVYWHTYKSSGNLAFARTWTFSTLILLQMLVAFIIRGNRKHANQKLVAAVVFTLAIQALILVNPIFYPIFKIEKIW